MSVRCLSETDKDTVIYLYDKLKVTIKDIAKIMCVSNRTIQRVIIERGYATPVPRLKGEAHQVMKLLYKYKVSPQDLEQILDSQAGRQMVLV